MTKIFSALIDSEPSARRIILLFLSDTSGNDL